MVDKVQSCITISRDRNNLVSISELVGFSKANVEVDHVVPQVYAEVPSDKDFPWVIQGVLRYSIRLPEETKETRKICTPEGTVFWTCKVDMRIHVPEYFGSKWKDLKRNLSKPAFQSLHCHIYLEIIFRKNVAKSLVEKFHR